MINIQPFIDTLVSTLARVRKSHFIAAFLGAVLVLFIVKCIRPDVAQTVGTPKPSDTLSTDSLYNEDEDLDQDLLAEADSLNGTALTGETPTKSAPSVSTDRLTPSSRLILRPALVMNDTTPRHKIWSVSSYKNTFPDVQDVQIVSARQHGVSPVQNREEAEARKSELVYVGSNPYYQLDPRMHSSIPYLVPRASNLLTRIGRTFLDSLAIKRIPLHRIIVTSVLRTEDDVAKLRRRNGNASEQSCHRFGTTFDICYNRYQTISNPYGPERRAVRNDSLKWVLSEVLRDMREQGLCHIKYEVKQGCFHITVR